MRLGGLLQVFVKFVQRNEKKGKRFEKRLRSRGRRFEMLEARHMLAAAIWHNVLQPLDVSGDPDGSVDPLDALIVINEINNPRFSTNGALISDVPPGQSLPYFDVTCDSNVGPLDVLSIINAINSGFHDPSWNLSTSNVSSGSSGHVGISSCSPLLIEGDSLKTELNQTVVLPDDTSAIRVSFEAPVFDTLSADSIRDAFEILVLDEMGVPFNLPFGSHREASYNWSENVTPGYGPDTTITTLPNGSISTATFNLSGLATGTKVQVVARLVNNDKDTTSSVAIRRVEIVDIAEQRPTGMRSESAARASFEAVNENSLVDVSSIVKPFYGRTTLIKESGVLITDLQVINRGAEAVSGRIVVAIDNLSDPAIGVMNPDGFLTGGHPYFVLSATSGNGWLASSQSTTKLEIRFINPSKQQFTYSLRVLAELNSPPSAFTSVPLREIEAGNKYRTFARAIDPDEQALTYSIVAGPVGMTIDKDQGEVSWSPLNADIGNHSIILRATDPFGLSVEQTFTISVFTSLQNRPPVITSTPPTDAKVSGIFEVQTYKTGANPIAILAGNFGSGTSYLTANAGDANLSLINGTNLTSVSIGEIQPDGRLFQSGANVDIGLPLFASTSDFQRLHSVAQADLDGNGNLDFVTSNYVDDAVSPGRPRSRFLAVTLGNGDGTFKAPTSLLIRTILNDDNEDRRPVGSLLIRDFDGDDKLDLLAISYVDYSSTQQNQLLFWHGMGDGSFSPVSIRDPGTYVGRIQAADVDRDGRLDLIATSASWDRIGIMKGRGDGTFGSFAPIIDSPGAGYFHTEGIADFDGRNGLDIAVTSYFRQQVDIFLNDGSGSYTRGTSLPIGTTPNGLFTGDFSGDGIQDIVSMNYYGSDGGGLNLYRGTGDGTFASAVEAGKSHPLAPVNIDSISAPADYNGDGKLDIVFTHHDSYFGVTVGLNKGDGIFDLRTYQNATPPAVDGNVNVQELSALVGDYNRDGMLDLAISTTHRAGGQARGGLTLLFADSPGHFFAPTDHNYAGTGGNSPFTGINYAADFNKDGNVDLFGVAFQNGHKVRFGNGDGTFQDAVAAAPALGNEFYNSGFHSDFNNDGFEDVLWFGGGGVQGGPGARIIVGFNDGNGAFAISVYSNPDGDYYYVGSVVPGDFNGDGHMDFAGRGNGYVDVWLYNTVVPTTFTRTSRLSLPPGEGTSVLSAADFTGDGIDDVVTATGRALSPQIGSLLHTFASLGDGTFGPIQTQPIFNTNSDALVPKWSAAGDLNDDGLQDLVMTSAYSRSSVFLGNGNGTFQIGSDYATGTLNANGRNVYLRDLNADGHLDMLAIDDNQNRSVVRVRYGDGTGSFSSEESYILSRGSFYTDFADFDGDGTTDVVFGTGQGGYNYSELLRGAGPGLTGVATADVNGDAKQDVIAVHSANNRVKILHGKGDSSFDRRNDILVGQGPVAVATLDFNNDNFTDIVTANRLGRSVTILSNIGAGTFLRSDISVGERLSAMAIGNLSGSLGSEIVVASAESKSLFLMVNTGTGFGIPVALPLGDVPGQISIGDVTGDGINDVVVSLPQSVRLMILPGDVQGSFRGPLYVQLAAAAGGIGLADFNQDGNLDISVTIPTDGKAAILFGRGGGRFAKPQTVAVGKNPTSLNIKDINADGLPDILVANSGDDTMSVIVNRYDPTNLYRYSVTATDPDGDVLSIELSDAPGGMLIDEGTGHVIWAPTTDQIGLNAVAISVVDGRGGSATQRFNIAVAPARDNAPPVVYSLAPTILDASQAYHYTPKTIDADGDSLRYRLLSGPTGATIDPITGEVTWDPRGKGLRTQPGEEGFVTVPFTTAMSSPSITVEGFFKLDRTDRSQTFFKKFSYMPYPFGYDTLELKYFAGGTLRSSIAGGSQNDYQHYAWLPNAGQWYHLALTFDDSAGAYKVFIDGVEVLSKISTRHLTYDGNDLQIGLGSDVLHGSVANFRMWNHARSADELRTGLLRNYAGDTPGLLIDYRFDQGDSQTIHNHSQSASNGRRYSYRGPWPSPVAGLAFEQTQYFQIQVEDGRGGLNTQSFGVTVVPPIFGSIKGTLFDDLDRDAILDIGESGLAEWRVFLDENDNGYPEASEPQTRTDADGNYALDRVYAGDHWLTVLPAAGYTAPSQRNVAVSASASTVVDLAASTLSGSQIRGKVTLDVNANGIPNELISIYESNFVELSPTLTPWSHQTVATSENGNTKFLGEFTNDVVTLSLNTPLSHNALNVSFDFYILKSWDGVNGPDQWQFSIDGNNYVNATFSNVGALQSYPQEIGQATNPSRTGAFAVNTLGYTFFGDTIYRFQLSIPHTSSTAKLTFRGINIQAASDESWGLNNVVVTTAEPIVAGWPVFLDTNGNTVLDAGEPSVTSDVSGNYAFTNLANGDYRLRLDNPAGWTSTAPIGGMQNVSLSGTATGIDFGLTGTVDAKSQPQFVTIPRNYATARIPYRFENVAIDPGIRSLTYSLQAAPRGMSIDPATGSIVWTPTLDDVGDQRVILKAVNDRGGVALQDFTIEVSRPNSDPIITSQSPTSAHAGVPFHYNVLAQDAEQTTLVYELIANPLGSSINSSTGLVTWIPNPSQIGIQQLTLHVRDLHGGLAAQSFAIDVTLGNVNNDPIFANTVRGQIPVTLPYFAQLTATDPDEDALTFALVNGPAGMVVEADGNLTWTPITTQFGVNNVSVSVVDGRGGIALRNFSIDVGHSLTNRKPSIHSKPANFSVAGKVYRYEIQADDADNDPIAFELVDGPSGLSLDPMRGTVRWVPAVDQFGQHSVTVRALDPLSGVVEQTFSISVRAVGGPPAITSIPPTVAAIGNTYLYSVNASDAEGDPLNFTLLASPSSMILNSVTGELAWTPTIGDVGLQAVIIQVSDGIGGFATQAFEIQVASGQANKPPTIVSRPPFFASANAIFTSKIEATDPENTAITYSLRRGPATMFVDPTTGTVTWTPTTSDIGTIIVAFAATDADGATAVQSFELSVLAANQVPIILSTAPTQSTARSIFRYDVVATDDNRDPLKYELESGPVGMTVDAFGRIRWQTDISDLGSHSAKVRVSDPRGGVVEQSFAFVVVPDITPPRVSVIPSVGIVRANSLEVFTRFNLTPVYPTNTVRISTIDDVGVSELTVTANGKPVALDAFGIATFSFKDWGFGGITVVARASDAAGNQATGAKAFAFLPYGDDPAVADLANPIAVITSPIESQAVTGFVEVVGSALSDNFMNYTLSYRRGDSNSYKTIASGSTRVNANTLGIWDTSLLENDEYFLRLEVQDDIFGTTAYEESVGVSGNFKLGNFRLSFADIAIPVAGIPITLARTYDTLRSDRDSELGFGWRLEFRNADLRTGLARTGLEGLGIYRSFKEGTKVYLTLPGGIREGFTFTPDIRILPGFGSSLVVATPRFTPDRGVRNSLSVRGGTYLVRDTGELVSGGGQPYNPAAEEFGGGYTLTTPEGIIYRIDGNTGMLVSAKDRNNNVLTFTDSGIHGDGVSLSFDRDARGRITKVADPKGKNVQYTYDSRGNLKKVTDRMGNDTHFDYRTDRDHYLERVSDPLGRIGVRANYGADGRLSGTLDGLGNAISISYDPDNDLVRNTNPLGQTTVFEYDEHGNVDAVTNALGATTRSTFDSNGNELSTKDPLGRITHRTFDSNGNVISMADPLGRIARFTFDSFGNPLEVVDPLGDTTSAEYDNRGNSIRVTNPLGQSYTSTSPVDGLQRISIPGGGVIESFDNRSTSTSTDSRGANVTVSFDYNVNPITRTTRVGGTSNVETMTYNANGNLLSNTNAVGAVTQYEYNAAGEISSIIDPIGRRTVFAYDEAGRNSMRTFHDGTTELTVYDAAGQVIEKTDRGGRVTQFTYDAVGQLIVTTVPDDTPDSDSDNPRYRIEYNAAGEITSEIDPLGRRTAYEYDAVGQVRKVLSGDGSFIERVYDENGRQIATINALGYRTEYEYNAAGQVAITIAADGSRTSTQYDTAGRPVTQTDVGGRSTRFEYTLGGLLAAVTDPIGNRTEHTYDELGRRLTTRDSLGRITRYEYSRSGQLIATELSNGQRSATEYDLAGRVVKQTDYDTRITTFTYDTVNRTLLETRFDGSTVISRYTPSGQLASQTDSTGTTKYTYSARDRMLTRSGPDNRTVQYMYDLVDNITQVTTPGGVTQRVYDSRNRQVSTSDSNIGVTQYAYAADGHLLRTILPNGLTESRTYSSVGQLVSIVTSSPSGAISSFVYEHDAVGRRSAMIEIDGRRTEYVYDNLDRLAMETVIDAALPVRTTGYAYDNIGNRISRTNSIGGTTTYNYNSLNQLTLETTGTASINRTYDASGRLIVEERGPNDRTDYTWNAAGLLARAKKTLGAITSETLYRYDAGGQLVSTIESGQETRLLVDVNRSYAEVLEEYRPDGILIARQVYGLERIAEISNGIPYFFLSDAMGTVRGLADVAGVVIATYSYDAFGNLTGSTGTSTNLNGFGGQRRDSLTGWDYLRARNYDPTTGRFVTRDPMPGVPAIGASYNPYVFAFNDPVSRNDPSGQQSLIEQLAAIAIQGYTRSQQFIGVRTAVRGVRLLANVAFWTQVASGFNSFLTGYSGGTYSAGASKLTYNVLKVTNPFATFKEFKIDLGLSKGSDILSLSLARAVKRDNKATVKYGATLNLTKLQHDPGQAALDFVTSLNFGLNYELFSIPMIFKLEAYGRIGFPQHWEAQGKKNTFSWPTAGFEATVGPSLKFVVEIAPGVFLAMLGYKKTSVLPD